MKISNHTPGSPSTAPQTRKPIAVSNAPSYAAEVAHAGGARRAVIEAAASVHRGIGETVGTLIGATISLPSDAFVQQPARFLTETATSIWDAVNTARNQAGVGGFFASLLLPLAAIYFALAFGIQQMANLIDLPFVGLRAFAAWVGGAVSPEHASRLPSERFHRVAARDWPRLPSNAACERAAARYVQGPRAEADVIIVPGFTRNGETGALSLTAESRLRTAIRDFRNGRAPFILVSGGNVHPAGTRFNEAFEMRAFLIASGVPSDAILVEPFATHSHTNLRNAGRIMRQLNFQRALVVSSGTPWIGQSRTFAMPSSFGGGVDIRSHLDFGVSFGSYSSVDATHTLYVPSADVDLAIATDSDP